MEEFQLSCTERQGKANVTVQPDLATPQLIVSTKNLVIKTQKGA
ncbi:hypothetical protein [Paenibacillus segetis]|nr:hypothetical protein [Paenibacillus segetis]